MIYVALYHYTIVSVHVRLNHYLALYEPRNHYIVSVYVYIYVALYRDDWHVYHVYMHLIGNGPNSYPEVVQNSTLLQGVSTKFIHY